MILCLGYKLTDTVFSCIQTKQTAGKACTKIGYCRAFGGKKLLGCAIFPLCFSTPPETPIHGNIRRYARKF